MQISPGRLILPFCSLQKARKQNKVETGTRGGADVASNEWLQVRIGIRSWCKSVAGQWLAGMFAWTQSPWWGRSEYFVMT